MTNLLDLMTAIEAEILELRTLIRTNAQPELCTYFDVPMITKVEEKEIIEFGYSSIDVVPNTGEEALQKCLEALSDFYVQDNTYSRRFVAKHPGVIVVSGSRSQIMLQVNKVNAAKAQFKNEVLSLTSDSFEKWREVHDRFSYLITTTVYRSINCFDDAVHRVNFNWVSRPRVDNLTKSEILEKIDKGICTLPPNHNQASWKAVLEADTSLIKSQTQEQFSIRRRIKLRPEASIRLEGAVSALGYSAGLPFIMFNSPKYFTPLDSFDTNYRRKRPLKEESMRLLIKRMNLYVDDR